MNRRGKFIAIFFAILVSVLAQTANALSQQLLFAYQNTSNYPFATGDGKEIVAEEPGIAVELILFTAKKLNITISLKRLPWKRGLASLKDGRIDGLFNASFKSARLDYGQYPMRGKQVDVSKKSYSNSYALYKLRNSPLNWDGRKITGAEQAVGVPNGFSIGDDLRKMNVPVQEAKSTAINFEKLLKGRLGGVAALESAADAILARDAERFGEIVKILLPLKTKDYYLMLSHQFVDQNPELAKEIWHTIGLIRDSEEFRSIAAKYY